MPTVTRTPTRAPLTIAEVFEGEALHHNGAQDAGCYCFPGHLTADEIRRAYFGIFPFDPEDPETVDETSTVRVWQVFTAHSDDCCLSGTPDPDDPLGAFTEADWDLCSCATWNARDEGVKYSHPHPADPTTPGAIAVTWAVVRPA